VIDHGGNWYAPFIVYHVGAKSKPCIEINFQYNVKKPPFDNRAHRVEWLRQLNQIPGVSLAEETIERRPNFPLLNLASDDAMTKFLSAMDWFFAEVRKSTPAVS
jgi:hypothetical protein